MKVFAFLTKYVPQIVNFGQLLVFLEIVLNMIKDSRKKTHSSMFLTLFKKLEDMFIVLSDDYFEYMS